MERGSGAHRAASCRDVSCISLELAPQPKKQIACTRSFGRPITILLPLIEAVSELATRAAEKLRFGSMRALVCSPSLCTPLRSARAQAFTRMR